MKNIKGYAWKNERTAAFYHATAEQAHEAFEEIRQRDGKLTPAAVVDSARPEESVLHEDFEWRDDVAAEKYRQGPDGRRGAHYPRGAPAGAGIRQCQGGFFPSTESR